MPNPPRIEVFSSGAQTMPSLGLKDLVVGFLKSDANGDRRVLKLTRLEILPLTSSGTVANSYRSPKVEGRFDRVPPVVLQVAGDQVLTQVAERIVASLEHDVESPHVDLRRILDGAEFPHAIAASAARDDVVTIVGAVSSRADRVVAAY